MLVPTSASSPSRFDSFLSARPRKKSNMESMFNTFGGKKGQNDNRGPISERYPITQNLSDLDVF